MDPNLDPDSVTQNLLKKSIQELTELMNGTFTDDDNNDEQFIPTYSHLVDSIFISGHSSGGAVAIKGGLKSTFDGLILIGAVLNSKGCMYYEQRSLASYPKPVLTVCGDDRDGFIRYLVLSKEMDCIDEDLDRLYQ